MTVKYAHSDVLDGGLSAIKSGAIRMLLLKAYTATDSYSTVTSNILASVTMASTDYTLSGSDGAARVLTTASGKSATASASGTSAAIAFTDNSSKVLWVTTETSAQSVTSGNTVNFPQLTYTSAQPV